jgi:hypothetical protein
MKGLIAAIGVQSDYWVILEAARWYDKGVLEDEDLIEIQRLIDEKNTPKPEPEPTPEPEPDVEPSDEDSEEEPNEPSEEEPVVITDEDPTPIEERVGMGEEDLIQETE